MSAYASRELNSKRISLIIVFRQLIKKMNLRLYQFDKRSRMTERISIGSVVV